MDLSGLIEKSIGALGTRFSLVSLLPAGLLALLCGFLVLGGAPRNAPQLEAVMKSIGGLGLTEGLLLALAVMSLAIVLQPFQTFFVRVLEGYWGTIGPVGLLTKFFANRHRKRYKRIKATIKQLEASAEAQQGGTPEVAIEAGRLADRLAHSYPVSSFLPTTLGNVLRAAEENASAQHGIDAVALWPLLYTVLPKQTAALVDNQRNQLDISVSFCVMSGMATVVSACLLYKHGRWLGVPAITLLLAVISYRGAILSAFSYGVGIRVAVELHRLDLLTALSLGSEVIDPDAGILGWEQEVAKYYGDEEFHCPTCVLHPR